MCSHYEMSVHGCQRAAAVKTAELLQTNTHAQQTYKGWHITSTVAAVYSCSSSDGLLLQLLNVNCTKQLLRCRSLQSHNLKQA
jgi:hypothetical protein